VVIRYGSVILAFGIGWLISKLFMTGSTALVFGPGWTVSKSLISGLGLAVIAYFIPDLVLKRAISQRRVNFGKQLIDVLILMTGAVRAGRRDRRAPPQIVPVRVSLVRSDCVRVRESMVGVLISP
jgi:Flp pilus assembly protein TadB